MFKKSLLYNEAQFEIFATLAMHHFWMPQILPFLHEILDVFLCHIGLLTEFKRATEKLHRMKPAKAIIHFISTFTDN